MGPTALAGVQEPAFLIPTHPSSGRFIPVFVLDLETDQPLLLDRTEQVTHSPTPSLSLYGLAGWVDSHVSYLMSRGRVSGCRVR